MVKFSVKKPLTVFVAVVIILVMGVISYTKMTPDLLPNLDMPYVIITTSYPGASPEKVEAEVTKPLEKSLATLENIENVTSTSNENYSMIALEFNESVNMDSITVDVLQKISTVEGKFDDIVGTPTIMKINPSMMPVMVAAVDVDDMNTAELSKFFNDDILGKLEGTEGVVSVNAGGVIEETVDIQLSDEKIKALNKKISAELTGSFDDKEEELLNSAAEIENGKKQISKGQAELAAAKQEFAEKTAAAESELDKKEAEVLEGKIALKEQIQLIEEKTVELQTQLQTLISTNNTVKEVESQKATLENSIKLLTEASNNYSAAEQKINDFEQQITSINSDPSLSENEKNQAIEAIKTNSDYLKAKSDLAGYDAVLKAYGFTIDDVSLALTQLNSSLVKVNEADASIVSALAQQGLTKDDLDSAVVELENTIEQLESTESTLNKALSELESGKIQLSDAMEILNVQKSSAIMQFAETSSNLMVTAANLDAAKAQLEIGQKSFDEAKETALKNADLTKLITKDMISGILTAENLSMPAGYAQKDDNEYIVTVGDEYSNLDDIKNQILFDMGLDGVEPIRVSDVAEVGFADNSDDIYAKVNENNGIVLTFQKQSTYATAEVCDNLAETFEKIEKEYDNVHFMTLMDQGNYIYMITDSLFQSLLTGALFSVLILLLFLKDIKPTVITLFSIPLSVLFALGLMYFSGVTLNLMSLSGLAIAVGMLVDNSVVVLENIYRFKSMGISSVKAAVSGATQVVGAIAASTLTTICVFLPIVFIEGMTKQLFTDMALTIAYSLLASFIIAITLVPSMAARLLRNSVSKKNNTMSKITSFYKKALNKALGHRFAVISLAIVLLVVSCVLSFSKGFIFMPESESNQVTVTLEMPDESKFEDTKAESDKIVDNILTIEDVDTVGAIASNEKSVSYYAILKKDAEKTSGEVAKTIEKICKDSKGEVVASGSSTLSSNASMLTGSGVTLNIYGNDLDDLRNTAKELEQKISKIDGISEVDNGIGETNHALKIKINKNKAMKKGLTVAQCYSEISNALKTEVSSTTVTLDSNYYTVNINNGENEKKDLEFIKDYIIETTDAQNNDIKVKLTDIADISETDTLASITRENQRRTIKLTAEVDENENITLITEKVKDALKDYKPVNGVTYEFDGENEMIMDSIEDLLIMLLLGVLLVYLVMVAQFQSLKSPFIVMFTIPLALTGGLGGLLICNKEVSVVSMMGFILLCGIIVNNGIVLVDYINKLRIEGKSKREAIVEAGATRLRPIFMTSITTVFGLIIMALGIGSGTDVMQPVAIVCIGGLIYATLLTLFVVPIIYDLMNRKEIKVIDEKELQVVDK